MRSFRALSDCHNTIRLNLVQKYLWLGKYVSAALVLGLAALSIDMWSRAAEVEPFDTAITSHFVRAPGLMFFITHARCL